MIFPKAMIYFQPTSLTDVVADTLFLKPVTQAEIINLVNNTKRKKSKDHGDIDMCLV